MSERTPDSDNYFCSCRAELLNRLAIDCRQQNSPSSLKLQTDLRAALTMIPGLHYHPSSNAGKSELLSPQHFRMRLDQGLSASLHASFRPTRVPECQAVAISLFERNTYGATSHNQLTVGMAFWEGQLYTTRVISIVRNHNNKVAMITGSLETNGKGVIQSSDGTFRLLDGSILKVPYLLSAISSPDSLDHHIDHKSTVMREIMLPYPRNVDDISEK
ncbi:hypothetical protein HGB07_04240 [Candidatus Roizmanbacteria bacterium]|nr:hypothetical protein [Candidatus Roizmanbacteria bacterium]